MRLRRRKSIPPKIGGAHNTRNPKSAIDNPHFEIHWNKHRIHRPSLRKGKEAKKAGQDKNGKRLISS